MHYSVQQKVTDISTPIVYTQVKQFYTHYQQWSSHYAIQFRPDIKKWNPVEKQQQQQQHKTAQR